MNEGDKLTTRVNKAILQYDDYEKARRIWNEYSMVFAMNSVGIDEALGILSDARNDLDDLDLRLYSLYREIMTKSGGSGRPVVGNSPGPGLDEDSGGYQNIAKRALEDSR